LGYRLAPDQFEFWQNRRFRLHERELYSLQKGGEWLKEYLSP
jgi:pyridoxamine 5'-phosphate oxidase